MSGKMHKVMIAGLIMLLFAISAHAAETALTSSAYEHWAPTWSPDGQWIVYVRPDASGYSHVWKVAVTGGPETQLTFGTLNRNSPAWSPDDSAIAYERVDADGYRRIYTVSPSGGSETLVTTDPQHYSGGYPNWSLDSLILTFGCQNLILDTYVCTAPASGGDNNWLILDGFSPVYSHTGDRIAYGCPNINGYTQLCTIPSGGGASTQLTSGDDVSRRYHNWSFSDGKIVYRINDSSGHNRIYSVPSTGGVEQLLTPDNEEYGQPSYHPTDQYILFQKGVGITWQIYYMRSNGSDQTPITNDSYNNTLPRWSPDGTKVLYLKTDATGFKQIYISDFNPPDDPVPTLSETMLIIMGIFLLLIMIYRLKGGVQYVKEEYQN